jgi:hypothetical protein
MTAKERRVWLSQVKKHIESKLKDAVKEGVQAYWPVSDTYDPALVDEARRIYVEMSKAIQRALREADL